MATEIISQILVPANAPYVNGVHAGRKLSAAILKNVFQQLVEADGRGITDKFVSPEDATQNAQIIVNRVKPVMMQPREMGANKNGATFSANQHYPQTETVGIDILQVLDDPIIIGRARQDKIPTDLLVEETEIFSNRLATILNGATFGCKLLTSWLADDANAVVIGTSDNVLNKFIEANSLLDEGDIAHGVDMFPEDTRVAVVKPSYRATLKTSGILVLGGANYAYDIARGAGVSAEAKVRRSEDGYIGDIDGVPCHIISNESLRHAAGFMGLPLDELRNGALIGYISSSYANARGVSASRQTKIVDAVSGQGVVLQPYVNFGVACWYPKGNVILTKEEYNPLAFLKATFTSGVAFKLKGAGSRLYPEIPATGIVLTSNTAFTLSGVQALDDFNTDHVAGAYYVVGATPAATVGEFAKLCEDGEHGTFTIGTSKSFTTALNNKEYVSCLVIADDGSVALVSKQYVA